MGKIENVLKFYILATSLKDKIRSGAKIWHISKERLESVAEHIYGSCILAIAIDSEYDLDINIDKVIKMLVIHELEEVTIGDLTPFDNISKEAKNKIGQDAVSTLLDGLVKKDEYYLLTLEFNGKETNDSKFASYIDKLEMILQMKLYEEQGFSNMYSEENKDLLKAGWIQKLITNGSKTISDLFVDYHKPSFNGDEVFDSITDYAKDNDIEKCIQKKKTKDVKKC